MYYLVKVKHLGLNENDKSKQVSEQHLVPATNWGDAEAQVHLEFEAQGLTPFKITYLNPYKIADVNPFDTGDKWFQCKYELMLLDETTDKEKKTKVSSLVQADTVDEATKRMHEILKGCVPDYTLGAVVETPIIEVFE